MPQGTIGWFELRVGWQDERPGPSREDRSRSSGRDRGGSSGNTARAVSRLRMARPGRAAVRIRGQGIGRPDRCANGRPRRRFKKVQRPGRAPQKKRKMRPTRVASTRQKSAPRAPEIRRARLRGQPAARGRVRPGRSGRSSTTGRRGPQTRRTKTSNPGPLRRPPARPVPKGVLLEVHSAAGVERSSGRRGSSSPSRTSSRRAREAREIAYRIPEGRG